MRESGHGRKACWQGLCVLAILFVVAVPAWGATLNARVVDPSGRPVADAVIYARHLAGTRSPVKSPRPVAVEQKEREFVPYVTVVQVGTTVNFPNQDPLLHHVYSFSPAKSFEIKLYSGETPRSILFDKPGIVTLGCNIHDWMIGYILVVESAYFGKTGPDGQVLLSDIAPGEFEVLVWHPTQLAAVVAKPIRFEPRSSMQVEFTIDAAPRKKRFKPPLDGIRYQ